VTYLNAILDLAIVALFGWLLLEIVDWCVRRAVERTLRREHKARMDALIAGWADEDRDFARMQKRIREGEK
jgi:hypothetical protein